MLLFTVIAVVCIGYIACYFFLFQLLPIFFRQSRLPLGLRSIASVSFIFFLSILSYVVALNVPDVDLGNLILHMFGGGFLAAILCYLVVRDTGVTLTRFQFFVITFLIVLALGVANEHLEFFVQTFTRFSYADTVQDTWIDLVNNSIGAVLGASVFTLRIPKKTA